MLARYRREGGSSGERRRSSRSASSSVSSSEEGDTGGFEGMRENYLVIGLLAALALLLLSEMPQVPGTGRTMLAQVGTTVILLLLGTCRTFLDKMSVALRRGPNPFLIALVAWAGYGLFLAPYRDFAAMEMLRVVAGAGAFFLAAYTLHTPRQISYVVAGMLGIGCLISLYDFTQTGQVQGGVREHIDIRFSVFGTHENVGSLLVLLLPAALAFALHGRIGEKQRLTALAATLILGGALLVARTRSAWLGGMIALIVLAVLLVRYTGGDESLTPTVEPEGGSSRRRRRRSKTETPRAQVVRWIGSPVVVIAIGFVIFVSLTGIAPLISKRAGSIMGALEDSSLSDRLIKWEGAAVMASDRPLTGWGLGAYALQQGRWTHQGDEVVKVLRDGVNHVNIAHNYYAQWAADSGGLGLFLYVATVAAFVAAALQVLSRSRGRDGTSRLTAFQQALLCAAVASIVGASVDAIASPAYNFHGVSTVFWLWMGLGVAAMRSPRRPGAGPEAPPALPPPGWNGYVGALGTAALVAILVVGWGYQVQAVGKRTPRGVLQLKADPPGPVRPGITISWKAVYQDEKGHLVNTMPGTLWDIQAESVVFNQAQATLAEENEKDPDGRLTGRRSEGYDVGVRYSVFRLLAPPTRQPIRMKAIYRDRYGRLYEAWSSKTVLPSGALPTAPGTPATRVVP